MLHGIHLLVGASIVDAVALGLHLIGARAVQSGKKVLDAGHFRAFIGRDIESHGRVIADALYRGDDIVEVDARIVRMPGIPRHPELLPHQDSVAVAQFVEKVALGNAASPQPQQVDAGLVGIGHLCTHSLVTCAEHGFGNPVAPPDENAFPIHDEHLGMVRGVGGGSHLPDAEVHLQGIGNRTVHQGSEFQCVQCLLSLVLGPPETGVGNVLGIESHNRRLSAKQGNGLFKLQAGLRYLSMQQACNRV